jgi:hypothetical protein
VQFQINFKKAVKVVAEALFLQPRIAKPEISVSAAPIVIAKPQQIKPAEQQPVAIQRAVQASPPVVEEKIERKQITTPPVKNGGISLKERYEQKMRKQSGDEDPLMEIARLHQALKKYS